MLWQTTMFGFTYRLKEFSVIKAVTMSLRSIIWVFGYILLLTTTTNRELVVGLQKLGVPHKVSVAVGMTLKFWGNILEDIKKKIVEAQKKRGVLILMVLPGSLNLKKMGLCSQAYQPFFDAETFSDDELRSFIASFWHSGEKKQEFFCPAFRKTDWGFIVVFFVIILVVLLADWK